VWFAGDTGYQTSEGPCPVFKGKSTHPSYVHLINENALL
jgi:hypothetical protein